MKRLGNIYYDPEKLALAEFDLRAIPGEVVVLLLMEGNPYQARTTITLWEFERWEEEHRSGA